MPFSKSVDVCRGAHVVETAFPKGMPVSVVNTCLAGESGPAITLLDVLTGTADCLLGLFCHYKFSYQVYQFVYLLFIFTCSLDLRVVLWYSVPSQTETEI